jgi:hypothetical protein
VPKLANAPVTPDPIQAHVNDAIAALDPVMRDEMPSMLRAQVAKLNRAGPTTIRDLNGIRSRFESIARNSLDGTERSLARTLSDAFMEGMDHIPEIEGRPAAPTGMIRLDEGASAGNIVPEAQAFGRKATPILSEEVKSDPEMTAAYQAARDYTRQMRTLFNNPDLAALLRKVQGVYTKDPSEGARQFFNFSNGSPEGAQTISQLADFLNGLKSQPKAANIASGLLDSGRAYVAAALSDASRLNAGQIFNPKTMQDFLRKNAPWMQTSGLFTADQSKAAQDLLEYADMLRRPELLNAQSNSATNRRFNQAGTFIDRIMTPWMRHIAEIGLVGAGASAHGEVGAMAASAAAAGFEHAVKGAETAMRELMAGAVLDSRVGADLARRGKVPAKAISPQTKDLLNRLTLQLPAQIGGRVSAAQTTNAPQSGSQ